MNRRFSEDLTATSYDRGKCGIGVVHLGYGAFHRAHQAVYFDDYMEKTGDPNWGIAAVNLRPADGPDLAMASASAHGYVLKTVSPEGEVHHRLIRSHVRFEDWSVNPARAEALLAITSVQVVTITVTESGYYRDDADNLNLSDPAISAEIQGGARSSVYAFLSAGLRKRMDAGAGPVTILCCDNIRSNGRMLETNLRTYLEALGDAGLLGWLSENVSFPCSMVDRITPRPNPQDAIKTQQLFGLPCDQTIMAEDFTQWVIEDRFAGHKPDLTIAGAEFTHDVDPYEETKIRILNGGHTCMTYLGALSGHRTFDAAMEDPSLARHFWSYETEEVLPALDISLPFDKAVYLDRIARRLGNRNIGDTIERICTGGFAKFPVFIRPTVEGCFKQGIVPVHGIRSIAGWYVFATRTLRGTVGIPYHEPNWDNLEPLIKDQSGTAFTSSELLWGDLSKRHPEFGELIGTAIKEVEATWPE